MVSPNTLAMEWKGHPFAFDVSPTLKPQVSEIRKEIHPWPACGSCPVKGITTCTGKTVCNVKCLKVKPQESSASFWPFPSNAYKTRTTSISGQVSFTVDLAVVQECKLTFQRYILLFKILLREETAFYLRYNLQQLSTLSARTLTNE